MPSTPGDKICHACGADCTGRPRVRTRRGNYYCEPCFELERSRNLDDALMAAIIDEESSVVRTCPSCQAPMDRDTVVCTACGYSRAKTTGGANAPVVEFVRPPPPRNPVWHVRVGAISTVLGAGGILAGLAGAAGAALGGAEPWTFVLPGVELVLALWLLSAGIGLTKRRVRAAVSIRRWATLKVVMSIVGAVPAIAAVRDSPAARAYVAGLIGADAASFEPGTAVCVVVLAALWSLAWPIVVLACLGRRAAQDDIEAW